MFLCDECHETEKGCEYIHLFKSYGPCENCGKVDLCADCKTYKSRVNMDGVPV